MRRLSLDLLVPALCAVTLVAFAAGSSSVTGVVHAGRELRWVALFALFLSSAGLALRGRTLLRLRVPVIVTGLAFLAIAAESALWSVDPRLTIERAGTFAVLLATAAAIGTAVADDATAARRVLWGIVAGAATVAALGIVVLAFDHGAAVQAATVDVPARFRGFGQSPDTAPLLFALCLPIAAWLALRSRTRGEAVLAVAVALGFDASIAASDSRGAIAAGFAGLLIVALLGPSTHRRRITAAALVVAMLGATIAAAQAPTSKGEASAAGVRSRPSATAHKPVPPYIDVGDGYPFAFDIGSQGPGEAAPTRRPLFGLSGRGEAWRGAIDLGNARPTLGYGFGTEDVVFINRYTNFVGGSPEDSYIGLYLQLGLLGVAAFLVLVGALVVSAWRSRSRPEAIVSFAVITAALVLAVVQSYIYSVGDIGTVTVWICAFLTAAVAGSRRVAA